MDFFNVKAVEGRKGVIDISPDFLVTRSTDLMVKARSFYAVWDREAELWSTDEYDVQRLVDKELFEYVEDADFEGPTRVKYMRNFDSGSWTQFRKYMQNISDNAKELDGRLIFQNEVTTKEDYATKKLPYPLVAGSIDAWDEIISTLYSAEERDKIEWSIGSIVSGDSRTLQKFLVFYGPSGTGKSTVLNIIQKLFEGYTTTFDAKSLGSNQNQFATEVFKENPLVAIQHDGDLSKIEDNTKLNSIISHEDMLVNEKYKPGYTTRINAFLYMGTNTPVKISDAKSGLIRRLIDVEPTGDKLPSSRYNQLMEQVEFEYGAIAMHCLERFKKLGRHYYDDYRPTSMMYKTDPVLNFVSDNFDVFKKSEYITTKHVYDLYRRYAEESGIEKPLTRQKLQNELSNYFESFEDRYTAKDGTRVRSVLVGFDMDKVAPNVVDDVAEEEEPDLGLREGPSIFDQSCADLPAQNATADGTPSRAWDKVRTTLSDLDTSKTHYVKVPENHIVIDFDITVDGERDLDASIRAAAQWPQTYAELSRSGNGVHLHYIYDGDPSELASEYEPEVEIKVYRGKSSLRRRLTLCNDREIAHISSGLPRKEKKMATAATMKSERGLRDLITRNLRKEIHPGTKPSVEFIKKILDDAYESDLQYDVSDMRGVITTFAAGSTNHAPAMIQLVGTMHFKSEDAPEPDEIPSENIEVDKIVFYDVEVYPNLFLVCWKYDGSDNVQEMVNPAPEEIEELMRFKLVGFNNRRYDNHILYGRYLGYNNEQLYNLSKSIINNRRDVLFREAYNLSYADIYDFSSIKQSLKKWEIELGIHHMEMEIPWDEPVPEDMISKVVEYCKNDVNATEAVFHARKADFVAREVLAALSGLPVNSSTQAHTARIIFGRERNPQKSFVYTDLSEMFPGYTFNEFAKAGEPKSLYKNVEVGEGGYVYAEPGMYKNVAVLDIASMHPNSIRALDLFGPYTKNFTDLVDARVAIKHKDFESARKMLDGKMVPFLKDESDADDLAYALKIIINTVYGLTAASFDNKFRDPRNKDNIVAKRGALFMVDLQDYLMKKGFTPIHIKTDSVKIANATPEIIEEVMEFGRKYGYTFEHEATLDTFCLVNKAVYIAREGDKWDAVGAEFQHPYVFKKLFTKEEIGLEDYTETRQVSKGSIYLAPPEDVDPEDPTKGAVFIGRIGTFIPVKEGVDGAGRLLRVHEGKGYAVTGTKGWMWARSSDIQDVKSVDTSYVEHLEAEAVKQVERFGQMEDLF